MTLRIVPRGDGKGHMLLKVGPEHHAGTGYRFVALHRLQCYAYDELEELGYVPGRSNEIDHENRMPEDNCPGNLAARAPDEHGRITRERRRSA